MNPIETKVTRAFSLALKQRKIDLRAFAEGKAECERAFASVATPERLKDFEPEHAVYTVAQNYVSVVSEIITELPAMRPLVKLVGPAEEEYVPSGPPWSPLTTSYFTLWAFFDASAGTAKETIGTVILSLRSYLGWSPEFFRIIQMMQASRMGLYTVEGWDQDLVVLRELITDSICRAIVPAGKRGGPGELWLARVLPPPVARLSRHVVFTTPYVVCRPDVHEYLEFLERTLIKVKGGTTEQERYESLMKYGLSAGYWNEYIFEAYHHHEKSVIYLAGLPDVEASRPHSRVNS